MRTFLAVLVASLLWCGSLVAQTVHLVGDSVSRGYALGSFSDQIGPSHPLYVFRSIWTAANAVLNENGVAMKFVYGNTGMYDSTAPMRIAGRVSSGMIEPKDIVIFEDAGDTSMDPDQYQAELESLIDAAWPAKVYVMTMFDFSPAPTNSQYDRPFVGGAGGGTRTINDAIRAAALVKGAGVIDMNAEMDAFQSYMAGQTTTHDFDGLGIHPYVFGQTLMVGAIFRSLGVTPYLRCALTLTSPARASWQALQYNAPSNYWGDSWPRKFINVAIFGVENPAYGCP